MALGDRAGARARGLLRRVFDLDVLACPRCPGRLRFIAEVTDRAVIDRVLRHLGEDPEGPPRRAWEPVALDPEGELPWALELPSPDSRVRREAPRAPTPGG